MSARDLTKDRRLRQSAPAVIGSFSWEIILVVIFIAVNLMNFQISDHIKFYKLLNATNNFLDKGFIALSMTFILLTGYIDISVASTVALSSVVMAVSYNALGAPMGVALVICLLCGTLCGAFNGLILTKFKELAPMIVTLSTQIIYRGIALIILENNASGNFPQWFNDLSWGKLKIAGDTYRPVILIVFAVAFIIYAFVLHKTTYGRKLYAIGKNATTARFSGIDVDRVVFTNYTLNGFMAAVTAIFLTANMGSTRPDVANAYEMDVIAMVVLGGVSTAGGKGRIGGVLIAIFIVGFLRYGLGLINVNAQILMIIIGALLVLSVAALEFKDMIVRKRHLSRIRRIAQAHAEH